MDQFENVIPHIGEPRIENFTLHEEIHESLCSNANGLLAFNFDNVPIASPKISLWEFVGKDKLQVFLKLDNKAKFREFLSPKTEKIHNEVIKSVYIELMYSVRKFCIYSMFIDEQCGAVLSQFHLTHLYFTSNLHISAEKVYLHFKELTFCHSLPFPPKSLKLFALHESKNIMNLFNRIYLRNLPLIRFLSLPNYALQLNFPLEPDPVIKSKKGKKSKTESKKTKKKK